MSKRSAAVALPDDIPAADVPAPSPEPLAPTLPGAGAPPAEQPEAQKLPLDLIDPSPHNPRKTFDDAQLRELADSMASKGQLQAVCVRPAGERYELVFGERRVRAARLLGWTTILGYVRSLSDVDARELSLTENLQRVDVDEYEEAAGFRALRDECGRSVAEIAASVGTSVSTVWARLKLAELDDEAREMARAGRLPASTALLAARVVGAERQREAIKEFIDQDMSYREAQQHVQRDYMQELGKAQFDTTDEQLVAAAGSCTKCPKRTGNQPELFTGASKDTCTDAACWKSKEEAVWQLKVAKAEDEGRKILPAGEAKKVFERYGGVGYDADYVDIDKAHYGQKSVRELAKKELPADQVVLARNPHTGEIKELLPKDVAKKIERKAAPPRETKESSTDKKWREQQAKEKAERERDEKLAAALLGRIIAVVEKKDFSDEMWRFLACSSTEFAEHETMVRFFGEFVHDIKELNRAVAKMSGGRCRAFVLAANLAAAMNSDPVFEAAKILGIDRKAVAKELEKPSVKASAPPAPGAKAEGGELPRLKEPKRHGPHPESGNEPGGAGGGAAPAKKPKGKPSRAARPGKKK